MSAAPSRMSIAVVSVLGLAVAASAADHAGSGGEQSLTDRGIPALARALAGKTESFVRTRLGRPDRVTCLSPGLTRLDYRLGHHRIAIRFRDGRVVDVGHDERQTGVREDDLIGPVGP